MWEQQQQQQQQQQQPLYFYKQELQPRDRGRIRRETQGTYGLSDLLKVGQNQLTATIDSRQSHVYIGLLELKSPTMSAIPGLLAFV